MIRNILAAVGAVLLGFIGWVAVDDTRRHPSQLLKHPVDDTLAQIDAARRAEGLPPIYHDIPDDDYRWQL